MCAVCVCVCVCVDVCHMREQLECALRIARDVECRRCVCPCLTSRAGGIAALEQLDGAELCGRRIRLDYTE